MYMYITHLNITKCNGVVQNVIEGYMFIAIIAENIWIQIPNENSY